MRFFYSKILKNIILVSFKLIFIGIIASFLIFSPKVIFNENNYKLNLAQLLNYDYSSKEVLTLYHVKSFDSGLGSIENFLKKQSVAFNRKFKNCYVVIKSLTPDELVLNIRENNIPDIYSFGLGVGEYLLGFLSELKENKNIRKDLIAYGEKNNKIYAYPYIMSSYNIVSNNKLLGGYDVSNKIELLKNKKIGKKDIKGLSLCSNNFLSSLQVLKDNDLQVSKENFLFANTQYESYLNFINGKSVSLLGSIREYFKCKNRENNAKLSSCQYNFLGKFTDLIQYLGVVNSKNNVKMELSFKFLDYILSTSCQQEIKQIGLLSTCKELIYESGELLSVEKLMSKELKSINVFMTNSVLEGSKQQLLSDYFI